MKTTVWECPKCEMKKRHHGDEVPHTNWIDGRTRLGLWCHKCEGPMIKLPPAIPPEKKG